MTEQLSLMSLPLPSVPVGRFGTFGDNRDSAIHRWFPFVEGYSHEMAALALGQIDATAPVVHDPFGGSGTTCLAASSLGMKASFCEVNPFMAWVAQTKVNGHIACRGRGAHLRHLARLVAEGEATLGIVEAEDHPLLIADRKRNYFPPGVAQRLLAFGGFADETLPTSTLRDLALLALASVVVPCSHMARRADLCRRRPRDQPPQALDKALVAALHVIADDIDRVEMPDLTPISHLCDDIRTLSEEDVAEPFDLIVTSPPYLNGTNYFRNTKLELLALGFIQSEDDLASLRTKAITAGINNVSSRRSAPTLVRAVEPLATQLDEVAYDQRIPAMVRLYFSDMREALLRLRRCSSDSAELVLDIGDSRFAGVSVPTDDLLVQVAEDVGWTKASSDFLRKRRSYDGTALKQVLLKFCAA